MRTILSIFVLILAFGCDDSGSGNGNGGSGSNTTKVIPSTGPSTVKTSQTMESTIDEKEQTFTIVEEYIECDNGELIKDTNTDVMNYEMDGDSLLVWEDGYDCVAIELTGGGGSIYNTWTFSGTAPLPSSASPGEGCSSSDDEYDGPPEGTTVRINKDGTLSMWMSEKICIAEMMMSDMGMDGSGLSFEAEGCDTITLEVPGGDAVSITIQEVNLETGAMKMKMTYGGKTCTLDAPGEPDGSDLTAADCAQQDNYMDSSDAGDDAFDEFFNCMIDAGIMGEM